MLLDKSGTASLMVRVLLLGRLMINIIRTLMGMGGWYQIVIILVKLMGRWVGSIFLIMIIPIILQIKMSHNDL